MKTVIRIVVVITLVSLVAVAAGAQGVTLTHIDTSASGVPEWIEESAERFKEKTGITVEVTTMPIGQIQERLLVLLAAGTAPDTSRLLPDTMPQAVQATVDLNPFVERDGIDRGLFPPGTFDFLTVKEGPDEGKLQVFPHGLWSYTTAYNVDTFNERGIAPPDENWTWADMLEIARLIHAGNENTDRFSVVQSLAWTRLGVLVHHAGGQWLDSRDNPSKSLLLTPEVRTAMQFASDLYEVGATSSGTNFRAGLAAMDNNAGPNMAQLIQAAADESGKTPFEFTWHTFPRGPSDNTGPEIQLHAYAMIEGTEHPAEAWEWLKFLSMDEESQMSYSRYSGLVPALRPATQRYFQERARENPSIEVFLNYFLNDATAYMRPMGWSPSGAIIQQWMIRAIRDREISIEEALVQADRAVNVELARP